MSDAATTGLFTLLGAISGVILTNVFALITAQKEEARRAKRGLRDERRAAYARYLDCMAGLETATDYLRNELERNPRDEAGRAKDSAGRAYSRATRAREELDLLADEGVTSAADAFSQIVYTNYHAANSNDLSVTSSEAARARMLNECVESWTCLLLSTLRRVDPSSEPDRSTDLKYFRGDTDRAARVECNALGSAAGSVDIVYARHGRAGGMFRCPSSSRRSSSGSTR
jgi:hypothetical protein